MISDWVAQLGVLALAAVLLYAPGMAVASALRLRGLWLLGAAPGISVGLIALLAIGYPLVGIAWSLTTAMLGAGAVALLSWVVALLFRRRGRSIEARADGWALLLGGLLTGCVLNAARLMTYVGTPNAISQTNDAVFHLNALRWIHETGSASSFDLSGMVSSRSFYPAAWHAVASLISHDSQSGMIAANMFSLMTAAVIWPLGMAVLLKGLGAGHRAVAFGAALSAGVYSFPQLMFEWGVLYPYALSLALVPGVVGLMLEAVRRYGAHSPGPASFAVAGLFGLPSIALSQPASLLLVGLMILIALSMVFLFRPPSSRRVVLGSTLVIAWLILAAMWAFFMLTTGPVVWRSYRSLWGAGLDVVLNSHSQTPAAIGISVLAAIGIVVALRTPRWRWLVLVWVVLSGFYVVAVATDLPVVKRLLTGPWYGDSFRLAAMVPIAVIPLAAIGLAAAVALIERRLRGRKWRRLVPAAAIVAVLLTGVIWTTIHPVVQLRVAADTDAQSRYAMNDKSYLSSDENRLLTRLPDLIPADALLIGNPSTGSSFAYSIGRRDIVRRTWSPPSSDAWRVLAAKLNQAGTDPGVCTALAEMGDPGYVLDFGPGGTDPGQYMMPGMTDFAGNSGFELVTAVGQASLWRIDACG